MNELNNKNNTCIYHGLKIIISICLGLVIGLSIVYFPRVILGLIILLVVARLIRDFYQLTIKGEGDVNDNNK